MSKLMTSPDMSRANKIGNAIKKPDRQSRSLANSAVTDERFVVLFQEKFSGMDTLDDQAKIQAVSTLANVLKHEKKRQLDTVIEIGRAFCQTEDIFSRAEWGHLMSYTQELFGMSKHTACMYRNVARDLDSGRIPKELCPPSFSTAYQLTTYTDTQLTLALEQGIITPEISRREAVAFKQKHLRAKKKNGTKATQKNSRKRLLSLKKERERLYKKLEKIEAQIAEEEK